MVNIVAPTDSGSSFVPGMLFRFSGMNFGSHSTYGLVHVNNGDGSFQVEYVGWRTNNKLYVETASKIFVLSSSNMDMLSIKHFEKKAFPLIAE